MTRTASSVGISRKGNEPKPIALFDGTSLYIDQGFPSMDRTTPERLRLLRWSLSEHPDSHSERIDQITTALEAFEAQNEQH